MKAVKEKLVIGVCSALAVLAWVIGALVLSNPSAPASAAGLSGTIQVAMERTRFWMPPWSRVRCGGSQCNTIRNNLRQVASAADQYFIEAGATRADLSDLVGTDRYIKTIPPSAAGEDYRYLFPIHAGFTELEISKADGVTLRYTN